MARQTPNRGETTSDRDIINELKTIVKSEVFIYGLSSSQMDLMSESVDKAFDEIRKNYEESLIDAGLLYEKLTKRTARLQILYELLKNHAVIDGDYVLTQEGEPDKRISKSHVDSWFDDDGVPK